jgi:hypothetical protein
MRNPGSRRLAGTLVVLVLAAGARAGEEESLRCPGGIVSRGDLKVDLLGKCGEPALRERSSVEEVSVARRDPVGSGPGPASVASARTASALERWTYDLGPSQFIRIVTLDAGRVRSVETGGRGYSKATVAGRRPLPVATCDYKGIRVGDLAYELLVRCGEPATRDVRLVERAVGVETEGEAVQRSLTVSVEVWAYHFGPQTFTRVVEVEDGKVVRVETGGHGYPP